MTVHVRVSGDFVTRSAPAIGHAASVAILDDHLAERCRARDAVGADVARICSDHAAVVVDIVFA